MVQDLLRVHHEEIEFPCICAVFYRPVWGVGLQLMLVNLDTDM